MKGLILILFLTAGAAHAQELTLSDAIARALANNPEIVVERESLNIADAVVLRAESAYEPTLRGDARLRTRTDPVNSILSGAPRGEFAPTSRTLQTSASLVKLLPTGGTVSLVSGISRDRTNSVLALLTPSWSTFAGAEVRQPLMQNRRIDPARRAIRIARADRSRALSSLRRTATDTTAAVERAYWSVVSAQREIANRQSALVLAERHRADTLVRIEAGVQSESELSSANAEVERRRGDVAFSREQLTRAGNALRLLIGDSGDGALQLQSFESAPAAGTLSAASAITTALENRPELAEMETRLTRSDIEIESALDRIRPQVDLVAALQQRGLGGTANADAIQPFGPVEVPDDLTGGLGTSLGTLGRNEFPDASIGVAVVIPIGNSAAKQDVAIARAQRRQFEASLEGVRQRITAEVRNALAAVTSAEERIDAARAARTAAEMQLQAERHRLEAGTSNTFFILTRQNELSAAQTAEIVAMSDFQKAQTELARATGTLLQARGIVIDGGSE